MFPSYNCVTCTAKQKIQRGCEQDAPFPYWSDQNGEERIRCPRRSIYTDPDRYLTGFKAFALYKDGFLPEPGGIVDQAALYPEVIMTLKVAHGFVDDYEEAQAKRKRDDEMARLNSANRRK